MQLKILIAFTGVALLVIIFGCPEHGYVLHSMYETDMGSKPNLPLPNEKAPQVTTASETTIFEPNAGVISATIETPQHRHKLSLLSTPETPKTCRQELSPFSSRHSPETLSNVLLRPFTCFFYPAVFWGFTLSRCSLVLMDYWSFSRPRTDIL